MPIPPARLDLDLAWRRAVADLATRRAFVRHPFLDSLVATELTVWQDELAGALARGDYRPASCSIVAVPKALGHIRPGADLQIADQVVYAALLQEMRPLIAAALGDANNARDYSYHLRADANHPEWFESFFPRWQAFDRDSVQAIDDGAQFVVVADIAGYYEDIDLSTLRSDLNALGVDADVLHQLMECLNRWPRVQRRGVPQGHSPSDILAKLYLRPVDLTLMAEGLHHRRWVDDFRIFCTTEAEARRALVVLSETLGRRGLVLQTAKSRILVAADARQKFDEVHSLLAPIQAAVAQELAADDAPGGSDLPPWQLDQALGEIEDDGAVGVLRTALQTYFLTPGHHFNKSLFHYLLRRLAAAGDAAHSAEIVALLRVHPEEFDPIADYCAAVEVSELVETEFIGLWDLQLLPYPYVAYQFLRWRIREHRDLALRSKTLVRLFAFEAGFPWYVRAMARALLGRLGDTADLERLEAAYANAQSDVEQAELLCSIQRMEVGRRNALFGRAAGDGDLPSKAVRVARGGEVRWEAC